MQLACVIGVVAARGIAREDAGLLAVIVIGPGGSEHARLCRRLDPA